MTEEKIQHNPNCKNDLFAEHFCCFVSKGFHINEPEKFEDMVETALMSEGFGHINKSYILHREKQIV